MNESAEQGIPPQRRLRLDAAVFVLLLAVVMAVGAVLIQRLYAQAREHAFEQLTAVSSLKTREVERWLADKTTYLAQPPGGAIATTFERWLKHGQPPDVDRETLEDRLLLAKSLSPEHRGVWLFDRGGNLRLAGQQQPQHEEHHHDEQVELAIKTQKPILVDFHAEVDARGSKRIALEIVVPLFAGQRKTLHPVGFMLYEIDPGAYLFPLIQNWPTASASAETVLFRVEGDELVYLNNLRHRQNAPLSVRHRLDDPTLIVGNAARGIADKVEGVDDRGQRTLGVVNPIPARAWFLLSKIDEDEVFAEVRGDVIAVATVATLLVAVMTSIAWFAGRHERQRRLTAVLKAEIARSHSEQKLNYLVRFAHDIVLLMDEEGRILEANDAAVSAYGVSREGLLRLSVSDLRHPTATADLPAQLDAARREGGTFFETVHCRADGSGFPVEVSSQLIEHEGRHYRQSIIRDISERRRTELALRDSEEQFRAIFASISDAILIQDMDDGAILDVNPRMCEMYGYTMAEACCLNAADLSDGQSPYGPAEAVAWMVKALEEPQVFEWRARRKDGGLFWAEINMRQAVIGGHERLLVVVHDVSKRKAQEQALLDNLEHLRNLNRKLEEAHSQLLQAEKMASLGQLAAGVAHELNNPIGFVHSNLGTLEGYLRDLFAIVDTYEQAESHALDGPALAVVRAIKQEKDYAYLKQDTFQLMSESKDGLARVRKIVQDLKDFSRVGETDWRWADLHQGLDSTLNIVWNELKYKCKVHKDYGQLPQVYCLPSQLNQVFMNILVNAGQSIEDKGEIVIRTGSAGDEVWVEIADTGKGIPQENLTRIFEPFYTTKPVGKGTGLGLSLSYSIIKKHKGRIEVESRVGRGSTFKIVLPVQPEIEVTTSTSEESA